MEIPSKYNASEVEKKWYEYWLRHKHFHSEPDNREPYTIVIPPPNVTGVLHMGHMLNNTIQDVLIRRARTKGYNACWVPGTDHASIATEAKVVNKLQEEGIPKSSLTRETFMKHAWEWTDKHGGIILNQLQKLGASCDWDRTSFTMDKECSTSVIKVFVDLFNKGLVYRGARMVNWDPHAQTAVSDEEVIHKEEQSKLYYITYQIVGKPDESVRIATTRPETILGDTAVCVNPNDERFKHLAGKKVIVPLVMREVPIIQDEYVDMEFGTGCLKITPAHDENDYNIGLRHKLDCIDIFNNDGTISENGELFVGEDRFVARDKIVSELQKAGNLEKVEDYTNKIGYSERTNVVIEPKLSTQWFLKMKDLCAPALENVMNDEIEFFPKKFKNVYRHWMENIKDWCISRQLWWGHRIPVYYLSDGSFVCAESEDEAVRTAQEKTGNKNLTASDLRQDEDVLDTWASSWLWPISVFNGVTEPDNPEISYYYPTNVLVTGHDIIFFWVARMIMSGYQLRDEYPFKHVYFTGMVRDAQRRKMSKSLGNSPEPLDLIEKYGADGVRVGMLLCSPAGGDLLFDESLTEQGRNFASKIWNAFRLIKGWEVSEDEKQPNYAVAGIAFFEEKLKEAQKLLEEQYSAYKISEALMTVYRLFWDDFSSWFLEIVKPRYGSPIDKTTYTQTISFFETMMKVLHPFMPFITEEIWQRLEERTDGETIMFECLPTITNYNQKLTDSYATCKEIVAGIRGVRKEKQIPFKEGINLFIKGIGTDTQTQAVIKKLGNISTIEFTEEEQKGATSFRVGVREFYIPIAGTNSEEEKEKITEELKYTQGFLKIVDKKLLNEKFMAGAPQQVIDAEQKKKTDALEKIDMLEKRLDSL
ncbi:MAG: valine--tRNA ligase [Bacteroidales bacterium]|nr:valine--tRNA ligase [Bacteroidales bacterium]